MALSASDKETLQIRNRIILEHGIPELIRNNFKQSPYSGSWYGKDDLGGYTYELARLNGQHLELITIIILKGERWIQIFLNIFSLQPTPKSLDDLKEVDGLKFDLPPNSTTKMRLRVDDFKGIPLFNFVKHKLRSFNNDREREKRIRDLTDLIVKDLSSIDRFVAHWHEMHKPFLTDWAGNLVKQ